MKLAQTTQYEPPFLSVIVPIFKQEKTIHKDLQNILQTLAATPYEFEVLAVVDGSKQDNSLQEVKKIKDKRLKAIGYEENRGKGYAVRYGMKEAKGDIVTFIDGGMDIDPLGITMLLEHMRWYNADIIIGSKLHPASIVEYPIQRKILTYGYYLLVKTLFGLQVRDTQTGLKAYKRQVLAKVLPRLIVKKFAFDIEILAVAHHLGYQRIYDAPVKVNLDWSNTTIKLWGENGILNMLQDTLAVYYRLRIKKFYDDDYQQERLFDHVLKMFVNKP
ncbi:glycosyltransferase [Patescibacteria group bacterium]|nr:glycosyltransferase [Patescibacteria group bacterium]